MSERLKKRSCQSGFLVNLPIFIVGVDQVIRWPLLVLWSMDPLVWRGACK